MDPRFQTSFIPKKPVISSSVAGARTINLFSLLATILFIGSIALSGGIFFYKGYLEKGLTKDKESLENARKGDDPNLIKKVVRLDSRIETSKKLINSHVAISPFFNFLSSITLKSVRFKDFNFQYMGPNDISLSLSGEALGYESVALQSDVLVDQEELTDTVIGDLTLQSDGTVGFSVNAKVKGDLLSYAAMYKEDIKATSTPKQNTKSTTGTTTRQ